MSQAIESVAVAMVLLLVLLLPPGELVHGAVEAKRLAQLHEGGGGNHTLKYVIILHVVYMNSIVYASKSEIYIQKKPATFWALPRPVFYVIFYHRVYCQKPKLNFIQKVFSRKIRIKLTSIIIKQCKK